jgi:hypothetical protein
LYGHEAHWVAARVSDRYSEQKLACLAFGFEFALIHNDIARQFAELTGFELLWSWRFKRSLQRFWGIQCNNASAIADQFAPARWFNYHRL